MTELLAIDPKEEDFECTEEFPGRVSIEGAFTGKSYYLTSQPLELCPPPPPIELELSPHPHPHPLQISYL